MSSGCIGPASVVWRSGPDGQPEIEAEPFTAFTDQVTAALPAAYAALP